MNVKSIFIALTVASIMTLGLPVRAADPVGPTKAEKSFDDCIMNARLKFKDGKGGCVANHPAFFEQQNVQNMYQKLRFSHAVSSSPAQCPAVFGWRYNTGTSRGMTIDDQNEANPDGSDVSSCNDKIRRAIGTDSPQCNCKALDEIAKGMSKEEFYEFERNFASRVTMGWKPADLLNPTNLAQVPAAPDNPNAQRLKPVQLGKADVIAAETAADQRRIQNEALVKLANERFQRIALAKAEDEARIKGGRATDPVGPTRAEKSFDDCIINARLKFKDGKGGCVANHPAFFEQQNVQLIYSNPQFMHAVSQRSAQCPAAFGWSYFRGSYPINDIVGNNAATAVSSCNDKIRRAIGTDSPQCNCKALDEIAKGMSKEEFYEFERSFASRVTMGWKPADLLNPTNVAQVPAAPDNPNVQRLKPVQLGKADVNAAETATEERRIQNEALAKLAEERFQRIALAKAEEETRIKAAAAKVESDRLQKEAAAKLEEEKRQRIALAKEEEEARIRAAAAKVEADRLQKEAFAKLEAEKLQRIALAKAEEEARIKAAAAKVEADRLQKEAFAKLEAEKLQRIALAKAEEVRGQKEALALSGQANRNAASTLVNANRKALIFGNDSYQSVPKLKNARADAKSMAEALTGVGYSVRAYYDLNERDMKKAIRDFAGGISGGDEVLLFYAGHGVQIDNANYLLPVDLHADDARTVRDEAIPLQRVLDDFGDAKAKLTLAIIDACRDNPFKGSGRAIGGRGLASTSAATGQMIMFSAGAGQQALDKVGPNDNSPNGLFTRIFLKHIQQKGITVDRVLRDVRTEVVKIARSIGHEQVPALYDQVVGDFYFSQ